MKINEDLLYDVYYLKHNYDSIDNLYKKQKLFNQILNEH
jgi:hypothetical protein